jgi:hypothetical protein
LPEDQKTEELELSQNMLETIDGLSQRELQYLITGDES